jgi:nitroreductase
MRRDIMILDLLKTRRSIRKFEDKLIEKEKVEKLKDIALLSPTSKSKRGWEFVFVEDKDTLKKLSEVKPQGGKMVADSALTVVVAVDDENNDVWVEDGSIAAGYLHLACHEMGLGSCWVQIRNRKYDYEKDIDSGNLVQEILGLPTNKKVLCMMAVGYPAEDKNPYDLNQLNRENIHVEKYSK